MNLLKKIVTQNLLDNQNCSRIFHGRGKLWPTYESIVIDYFSPTILITLYKELETEFINEVISTLKDIPEQSFENILIQKRYLSRPEISAVTGCIPDEAKAIEDDAQFHLKFNGTQNTGFFLDMSLGRKRLRQISAGKKVLNLFAYTCSLSIAALLGGADAVVNVDMSKAALSIGESNHILNKLDMRKARFLAYDIMKSWNKILKHGPYDIVVIDPPTNQGESFKVERDYYKIVKRLHEMTGPEAKVFACLNSPHLTGQFLIDLFSEHAPNFLLEETIYSAFSSMEANPEEGLKILVFKRIS